MISVVIPAYNSAGTIREAMDSVRAQSFKDLEMVVVDDASTDDTRKVVEKWIGEIGCPVSGAGSCRLLAMEKNCGPAGARNRGIEEAQGEWIAFLDGDDAWLPWRLEDQVQVMGFSSGPDLVCAGMTWDWRAWPERAAVASGNCRDVLLEEFIDGNPVATSTVLARKEAVRGAGMFDGQFRGPEDFDLWMRMAARGRIVKFSGVVARYRERPGSLSMNPGRFMPQVLRVYDKAFGEGGVLREYRHFKRRSVATRLTALAWTENECGHRLAATGLLARSWKTWPGRLKVEETQPLWRLKIFGRILLNRKEGLPRGNPS